MTNRMGWLAGTSLIVCAALAGQAAAEEAAVKAPASQASGSLVGEIVVTAQLRSQPLSQVPAAVSALGAEALVQQRIQGVKDLETRVPSLKYARFNLSDTQIYIRGVGSNIDSAMLDRSVAMFIDDVYIGRAAAAAGDIFDLQRIEVLRGPQGTLYGKNVVGGAVNYVTPTPGDAFSGRISGGLGNYNERELGAVVSGGLAKDWTGSLSASYHKHGGYNLNLSTGNRLDDEESYTTRGILAYSGDGVRLKLSADYETGKGAGRLYYPLNNGTVPVVGLNAAYRVGAQPRAVYMGPDGYQKVESYGATARAEFDVLGGTLTSITAARGSQSNILVGYVGSGTPRQANGLPRPPQFLDFYNTIDEDAHQISQEFRFLREEGNWTLLTGVYALRETIDRYERTDQNSPTAFTFRDDKVDGHTTSYAGFVDVSWRPIERLELDAGVRYTVDKRNFDLVHSGTPGPLVGFPTNPYPAALNGTWRAATPKFSVRYELAPSLNAYALASRGFKSGGFDGQPGGAAGLRPIAPEYVWNYEAGIKGLALGGRLRFELDAFQMDYTNLQVNFAQVVPGTTTTVTILTNAAAARIRGIESTFQADLGHGFELGGTYAYLDSEITKSTSAQVPLGGRLPSAPKLTYSVTGAYTRELSTDISAKARIEYSRSGSTFANISNQPHSFRSKFDLLNASLTLTHRSGYEFSIYGRNLENSLYPMYVIGSALGGPASWGTPRTYGASLAYKW